MKRKVAVHARYHLEDANVFAQIVQHLEDTNLDIVATESAQRHLEKTYPKVDFSETYDFFVVVGGDGSVLHVVHQMQNFETPLLGISAGTLGFMSEVPPGEFEKACRCFQKGQCTIDYRMLLKVKYLPEHGEEQIFHALNEVVVSQNAVAKMVSLKTTINGEFLTTYRSDGLIIATPTGSTAYSLSAGGPILHPRFEAMILTPISPHSLTHRPLIIPADKTVEISEHEDNRFSLMLTIDGQSAVQMEARDKVQIEKHPQRLKFLRLPEEHFFKTIKRKLYWGSAGN